MSGACGICGVAGHNRSKCGLLYDYDLRRAVRAHLAAMDAAMQGPSTVERGCLIGALCSRLEMALDMAERFGVIRART